MAAKYKSKSHPLSVRVDSHLHQKYMEAPELMRRAITEELRRYANQLIEKSFSVAGPKAKDSPMNQVAQAMSIVSAAREQIEPELADTVPARAPEAPAISASAEHAPQPVPSPTPQPIQPQPTPAPIPSPVTPPTQTEEKKDGNDSGNALLDSF